MQTTQATESKATILIVDDEPDVREVLEEYFSSHGYTALCADGAASARTLAAERAIDLALFGAIGITVWAVQMVWIPITAAGIINGLGHWWGYRNFEAADASTNISPWGIIIGGEELHNNHHTYPTSAKFSVKPFEFDIGWGYIRAMEMLGWAKVRKTAPQLQLGPLKPVADAKTLEAIIANRYEVMANYAKELRRACAGEVARVKAQGSNYSAWSNLRVAQRWLHRDMEKIPTDLLPQVESAVATSPVLLAVVASGALPVASVEPSVASVAGTGARFMLASVACATACSSCVWVEPTGDCAAAVADNASSTAALSAVMRKFNMALSFLGRHAPDRVSTCTRCATRRRHAARRHGVSRGDAGGLSGSRYRALRPAATSPASNAARCRPPRAVRTHPARWRARARGRLRPCARRSDRRRSGARSASRRRRGRFFQAAAALAPCPVTRPTHRRARAF